MNRNKRVRQIHRWLAIVFTVTVVITVVALALGGPVWVSYLPLPPLALLLLSGLAIFVLPYATARRSRPAADIPARQVAEARGRMSAQWVRQLHRWSAIVFISTVLATFVALAQEEPVVWVSYLPLLPLASLLFSGLYMFVLPYATKWRSARQASSAATNA
ncbi:hypothetical protein OHA40_02415 [Nocardia sp. NBC_00508]|uniref:hypothetical protein n=1 Tax=Nocardia sp. NBC_00508 TaxID=2975992 RepID=UPI002E810EC9|nr:hypothetical protein [Nocardia sp. NBC_00508]WUD67034.1 hypothetical protein OHA40_02415 [Nocardia sp. NBC_00508]